MHKRFTSILAAVLALLSLPAAAQYYTLEIDTQRRNQDYVIPREYGGNTLFLKFVVEDKGVPINFTNWNVYFKYGYGQYDTSGMVTVEGSITSNTVTVIDTNQVVAGSYYWSLFGTNTTGYSKSWATGLMNVEYDPASSSELALILATTIDATDFIWTNLNSSGLTNLSVGGVVAGDKGDITVSGGTWTIDEGVVGTTEIEDGSITETDTALRYRASADYTIYADSSTNYYAVSREGLAITSGSGFSTVLQYLIDNQANNFTHVHLASSDASSGSVSYWMDSQVDIGALTLTLSGEGNPQTKVKPSDNFPDAAMFTTTNNGGIVTFRDIRFEATGTSQTNMPDCIWFDAIEPVIQRCEFTGFTGAAAVVIQADPAVNWAWVLDSWFVLPAGSTGIVFRAGTGSVSEFLISRNKFVLNAGARGIHLDQGVSASSIHVWDNRFDHNSTASTAIYLGGGSNHSIVRNYQYDQHADTRLVQFAPSASNQYLSIVANNISESPNDYIARLETDSHGVSVIDNLVPSASADVQGSNVGGRVREINLLDQDGDLVLPGDLDLSGLLQFGSLASTNKTLTVSNLVTQVLEIDGEYTFPAADGTAGQALITDGANTIDFGDIDDYGLWTDDGDGTISRASAVDISGGDLGLGSDYKIRYGANTNAIAGYTTNTTATMLADYNGIWPETNRVVIGSNVWMYGNSVVTNGDLDIVSGDLTMGGDIVFDPATDQSKSIYLGTQIATQRLHYADSGVNQDWDGIYMNGGGTRWLWDSSNMAEATATASNLIVRGDATVTNLASVGSLKINSNWQMQSETAGSVERLTIKGTGIDDAMELFLHPTGSADTSRLTISDDVNGVNYDGVAIEATTNQNTIGSVKAGTGTAQPLVLQMDGADALTIATNNSVSIADDLSVTGGLAVGPTNVLAQGGVAILSTATNDEVAFEVGTGSAKVTVLGSGNLAFSGTGNKAIAITGGAFILTKDGATQMIIGGSSGNYSARPFYALTDSQTLGLSASRWGTFYGTSANLTGSVRADTGFSYGATSGISVTNSWVDSASVTNTQVFLGGILTEWTQAGP